jgi:hypothetical protein
MSLFHEEYKERKIKETNEFTDQTVLMDAVT